MIRKTLLTFILISSLVAVSSAQAARCWTVVNHWPNGKIAYHKHCVGPRVRHRNRTWVSRRGRHWHHRRCWINWRGRRICRVW